MTQLNWLILFRFDLRQSLSFLKGEVDTKIRYIFVFFFFFF